MTNYHIIRTKNSWIEGEAEVQLERVSELAGMERVVGMPDLHPGKGSPIGAAFFATTYIYPYLVGNDIGCGMGLWQTDQKVRSVKLDRWEKKLRRGGLEGPWDGDAKQWLSKHGIETDRPQERPGDFKSSLGTVGGGNHFAELLEISEVNDHGAISELGLDSKYLVMLIHSGSRGLGEHILRTHVDRFADAGLSNDSEEARDYLHEHDRAVGWARANRELIAERMAQTLRFTARNALDVAHNTVELCELDGSSGWLHRKGAAPSDRGVVPIPGSRGSVTYLVRPMGDGVLNGHSLAHGAGRRWKRSEAKGRLRNNYSVQDLERTDFGGRVICDDRDLLYEEAPQAYKSIDDVVQALVDEGVAEVVAVLRPILTYKTSRRGE